MKMANGPDTQLLPVFRDLIKPQWLAVIQLLKQQGSLPISEIARQTGASYMAAKAHCDQLADSGYLRRTRLPRAEVGRPEIFYSLAAKAGDLFPQAGAEFALDLLDELRAMHGESAPERLLFQHFAKTAARWEKNFTATETSLQKAAKLAALRRKTGHASEFLQDPDGSARIIEIHNPLHLILARFPRSVSMEQRMIEQLLGCRVVRSETASGPESPPRVVFQLI